MNSCTTHGQEIAEGLTGECGGITEKHEEDHDLECAGKKFCLCRTLDECETLDAVKDSPRGTVQSIINE